MANQRMGIRCLSCGDTFSLAKRMGSGFYAHPYYGEKTKTCPEPVALYPALNDWFDKHEWCDDQKVYAGEYNTRMGGVVLLDIFELVYEGPRE